jgi:hypothetical protein
VEIFAVIVAAATACLVTVESGEESVVMEASRPVMAVASQAVVVVAVDSRLVVGTFGGSLVLGMVEDKKGHAVLLQVS